MSCKTHDHHDHTHGEGCGHTAIKHNDHVDYLHDDHLHHVHGDHIDECSLEVGSSNSDCCTKEHSCSGHEGEHAHGKNCGHEAIPHGDHVDYIVSGHLHHPCEGHCDDHGSIGV